LDDDESDTACVEGCCDVAGIVSTQMGVEVSRDANWNEMRNSIVHTSARSNLCTCTVTRTQIASQHTKIGL